MSTRARLISAAADVVVTSALTAVVLTLTGLAHGPDGAKAAVIVAIVKTGAYLFPLLKRHTRPTEETPQP